MRITPAAVLAAGLALTACGHATHPGAVVWGTVDATAYEASGKPAAVSLAPRGAESERDPDIEAQLALSLDRRRVTVAPGQRFVLRYLLQTVPVDAENEGLGVLLGGAGGSSGNEDVGVGLDLPLFGGGGEVRHTAFLLELTLERGDGTLVWQGSANGRSRASAPPAILRPVVPVVLDWLGSSTRERPFTR